MKDAILSRTNDGSADEYIKRSAAEMICGSADMMAKKRYADLLGVRFLELKKKSEKEVDNFRESCLVVKELRELRDRCFAGISELRFVRDEITASISGVVRIMMKNSMNNVIRLEDELMNFIGGLMSEKLLSLTCVSFYLRYKELYIGMSTVAREDSITDAQCARKIAEIYSLVVKESHNDYLKAAEMLMQLLYWHRAEIKVMNKAGIYMGHIDKIKKTLEDELFTPVIEEFAECSRVAKGNFAERSRKMCKYRSTFVKLHPYLFVVNNAKNRDGWLKAACSVWYCDLEQLAQAESFKEEGVDCLLELKRVAPDVSNERVRIVLVRVLEQVLLNMLTHGFGKIPLEKIMTISQWIDDLVYVSNMNNRQKEIDNTTLKTLNDSVSRRLFTIRQVAPESVARKRKQTTTASTTSDWPWCYPARKRCQEMKFSCK